MKKFNKKASKIDINQEEKDLIEEFKRIHGDRSVLKKRVVSKVRTSSNSPSRTYRNNTKISQIILALNSSKPKDHVDNAAEKHQRRLKAARMKTQIKKMTSPRELAWQ